MKSTAILISALFIFSMLNGQVNNNTIHSQANELDSYHNYHGIQTKGNYTHLLDSLVIYSNSYTNRKLIYNISYALYNINKIKSETIIKNEIMDPNSSQPYIITDKTETVYDFNGYLGTITKSTYDSYYSNWTLQSLKEFDYSSGYPTKLIKVLEYDWNSNKNHWDYSKKTGYKYTSFGEIEEISVCIWNTNDIKWDSSSVVSYKYDLSNRLISVTDYVYNTNVRIVSRLYKTTYNSTNLMNKYESYEMYNSITNDFNLKNIYNYTYYPNNKLKEAINTYSIFQNNLITKYSYTYNSVMDKTTTVSSNFDSTSNKWDTISKLESYLDLPINTYFEYTYNYDNNASQWLNDSRMIKEYDKDGNLESDKTSYFDSSQNKWLLNRLSLLDHDKSIYFRYTYLPKSIYDEHYLKEYDIENAPISNKYFNVGYTHDSINPSNEANYYYSNDQLLSIKEQENSSIQIFPNPSSNFINIQSDHSSSPTNLKLYNILGKEVFTTTFKNNFRLDVSRFSKGVYICQLIEGDYTYNRKIIIE